MNHHSLEARSLETRLHNFANKNNIKSFKVHARNVHDQGLLPFIMKFVGHDNADIVTFLHAQRRAFFDMYLEELKNLALHLDAPRVFQELLKYSPQIPDYAMHLAVKDELGPRLRILSLLLNIAPQLVKKSRSNDPAFSVYQTRPGTTPVHEAARMHLPKKFMNRMVNIDPNALKRVDDDGRTPLHHSIAWIDFNGKYDQELVRSMIARLSHANITGAKNQSGKNPWEVAWNQRKFYHWFGKNYSGYGHSGNIIEQFVREHPELLDTIMNEPRVSTRARKRTRNDMKNVIPSSLLKSIPEHQRATLLALQFWKNKNTKKPMQLPDNIRKKIYDEAKNYTKVWYHKPYTATGEVLAKSARPSKKRKM